MLHQRVSYGSSQLIPKPVFLIVLPRLAHPKPLTNKPRNYNRDFMVPCGMKFSRERISRVFQRSAKIYSIYLECWISIKLT